MDIWGEIMAQCDYVCVDNPAELIYTSFPNSIHMVSEEQLVEIIKRGDYDVIVFSSLPTHVYQYVMQVPKDKIVIWQSVGYDIYDSCFPYHAVVNLPLYRPFTQALIRKTQKKSVAKKIRHLFSLILKPITNYHKRQIKKKLETDALYLQNKVMQRIDYVSTVLDPEYDLLKKHPYFKAKFINFKYILPPSTSYNSMVDFNTTQYLLVGNSGDETNNHIDILKIVTKRGIVNPLLVPLAYGGSKDYVEYLYLILQEKTQNVVLRQFMEREKYLELLHKCRTAVFGHIRQQALGNINVLLSQGCKVFLFKDSVTYKYYKQLGLSVFSIEDDLTQENIDTPLSVSQIMRNREYFEKEYKQTLKAFKSDVAEIENSIAKLRNQ